MSIRLARYSDLICFLEALVSFFGFWVFILAIADFLGPTGIFFLSIRLVLCFGGVVKRDIVLSLSIGIKIQILKVLAATCPDQHASSYTLARDMLPQALISFFSSLLPSELLF